MMDSPSASNHRDPEVKARFSQALSLMESDRWSEAEGYLLENCRSGCSDSMVLLGNQLSNGDYEDKRKALGWFLEAAETGDSSGMRNAGYCYALGIGCEKDKGEAVRWYRMSAERGNAKAQCNLGVMYAYGNGVEKDEAEAAHWYLKSSENGYSRGQTNLGVLLLEGRGVEIDKVGAEKWLRMSGTPRANYYLARLLLDPYYGNADRIEALSLLRSSSSQGYTKAMMLLSELISDEDGDESERLLEEAEGIKNNRRRRRRKTED